MKPWMALSLLLLPLWARAEAGRGRWGVGLNTPGVGLRYFASRRTALELRAQATSDVSLAGVRVIRYFRPESRTLPYLALEGDLVRFDADSVSGTGVAGVLAAGLEHFLRPRLSLQLDMGPAYSRLEDDTGLRADGVDIAVNAGVTFYFGRAPG